jgi:D-alanyl-D-alanine carboxypeptidase (penicillin-binding protein 5/6)
MRVMLVWALAAAALLGATPGVAQQAAPLLTAGRVAVEPAAPLPALAFNSHYLVDYATGHVLSAKAADEQVPPASLTKLMTAYVVFGALANGRLDLDEHVHVSERAWRMGGTRMFIEVNTDVRVADLVRGMLIQSGNDASVALAEHLSGSVEAFVAEMNAAAVALGMTGSTFRNPHGLPSRGHVSTARDLAVLAHAIIRQYPQYYGIYAERQFSYNDIQQRNRNALLWRDASVDGMKTGYTEAAGYCLVTSAERDGMRLIAVVLGAPTARQRNEGAQKLLDYGFANYETRKLYSAGEELEAARVRGGELEYTGLGIAEDLYVTIPRGAYTQLAASMDVLAELAAPLLQGTTVGEVKVVLAGEPVATTPVVVLTNVLDGGMWARIRDEFSTWLE